MIASQFQGFCRNLHSECVDHLVAAIAPAVQLEPIVRTQFTHGRQLDQRNAQPSSLGADFGRLGLKFWREVESQDSRNEQRQTVLTRINNWRNAIAHQDFVASELGGTTTVMLKQARGWRRTCNCLARAFDEVMRLHLQSLLGASPW